MTLLKVSPGEDPAENYRRFGAAFDAIDAAVAQIAAGDSALAQQIQAVRVQLSQLRDAFVVEVHDRIDADRIMRDGNSLTFQNLYSTLNGVAANADQAVTAALRTLTDLVAGETAARLAAVVPSLQRPGDGRQSFTRGSLSGFDLPPLPDGLIAVAENGSVARVTGADIVAARRPVAIEIGRRYRLRFVVQRRRNVADPSSHAIRCGVAWLDQAGQRLRGSAGITVVRDLLRARTSDGRLTVSTTVARFGIGTTLAAPAGAVYGIPFVQTFGDDGVTDIEVMDLADVTDLAVLPDLSADTAAAVQALQAQNLGPRLEAVEAAQSGPGALTFATRGDAAAATVPNTVTTVATRGLNAAGDGQSALYRRGTQAQAAAAEGAFQSADGASWLIAESADTTVARVPGIPLRIGPNPATPAPYLSKIAYGQVPVLDMFGPYRDGVRADEPLLNAILDGHNACRIKPTVGGVGPVLAKDGPVVVPQNGKLAGLSGKQLSSIARLDGYTGDTLQMGTPTIGMGSAEIENLWFPAPGRFVGAVPAGSALRNRLTNGAAAIRAYGSQSGAIRNCGGFPICFFIAQQGGYDLTIDHSFTIGGLWDRTNPALQESIAVLVTNYDPVHGCPACTSVINPNWVGGNISAETRQITLYGKTYTCQERIGPKYGWLHAAGEDCQLLGGFLGGFSRSPIAILPGGPEFINGRPAWIQIKFSLIGARIDESMWAGIEALRSDASQAVLSILSVFNCEFNGQLVGAHGIDVGPSSLFAIARLRMANNLFAAYQGAGARFYAVDGGEVDKTEVYGFNAAGFDTTKGDPIDYGAGVVVGGLTRNLSVTNLRGGGGANRDADPNSGQFLFADTTPVANGTSVQGNAYRRVRAINLGLAGGAPVVGGVNDTAP